MSSPRFHRTRVGLGIIGGLLLTSCGAQQAAGDNKAGGAEAPVVLTMADAYSNFDYEPAVGYFVDRVEELSDGALVIETTHEWGGFTGDMENVVVRDVAADEVDLGWVGSRIFDTLGVNAFRALTAPMLIDSYPLQAAVISSDIPAEMLVELDDVGVTGIAVLADGLRKPIAVEGPLLSPADFDGITFQTFRSTTQSDAIRALGAEPIDNLSGLENPYQNGLVDGYEKSLHIYRQNGNEWLLPYVTANVNLWPQTAVLIANPATLADLDDTQRDWVMQAGADAAERSSELADRDADLLPELCANGARFATATEAELEAFREAFEPIYATLEQDPQTADFIDRIEELKASTDPGPALDIPENCTGVSPHAAATIPTTEATAAADTTELDGIYRWTLTEEDALTLGTPDDQTPEGLEIYPNTFTVELHSGKWTIKETSTSDTGSGTYTVDGDRIAFNWRGTILDFTFTVDDDGNLQLEPVGAMDARDAFVWTTKPWERIAGGDGDESSETAVTELDGTYRWTLTEEDARAFGDPMVLTPEFRRWYPLESTLTLDGGRWTLISRSGDLYHPECDVPRCTYTVADDHIAFIWPGGGGAEVLEFTFTVTADGNLELDPAGPLAPDGVFVWTYEPLERID